MVYSVTEEKPLKYPRMFRSADLVNEADHLPHLRLDVDAFVRNLEAVNPGVRRIVAGAASGEGVDGWCFWLERSRG